jgi:hypothetical protein
MSHDLGGQAIVDLFSTREAVARDLHRLAIKVARDACDDGFEEGGLKNAQRALRRRDVADGLEACDRVFTFARSPQHK